VTLTEKIKSKAHELGFELTGVAPVEPFPELDFYRTWIEAGYAGEMHYLKRGIDKRENISQIVPEAKSVIACGMVYNTVHPLSTEARYPDKGWISRYSWGDDYHDILQKKLFELVDYIKSESTDEFISRLYVDTGPVLDRVYARYAGLGWFGKNTCLINQKLGSWFFLGEIITSLELDYDAIAPDRCGSCNRCIEACPTDAILEPYILDSRKCISYLTIELRDEIPVEFRKGIGNHVYGCDICQDVCPWNRKAATTELESFQPRAGLLAPDLARLARMTIEDFRELFRKSPVKRTRYTGLMRNIMVAIGNSGNPKFLEILDELAVHEDPWISEHAKWAKGEILKENLNNEQESD
jgi:epoxyqueuosine reductase